MKRKRGLKREPMLRLVVEAVGPTTRLQSDASAHRFGIKLTLGKRTIAYGEFFAERGINPQDFIDAVANNIWQFGGIR